MAKINRYYKKLEIDEIFSMLSNIAILPNIKEEFLNMEEINDLDTIKIEYQKIDEAMQITNSYERSPIYVNNNLNPYLDLAIKNSILVPTELYDFVRLFNTINANKKLLISIQKNGSYFKYYQELVDQLQINPTLEKLLKKSIDFDGNILDDASPELKRIRNKIRNIDDRIKDKIQEVIKKNASMLKDSVVVLRNDRYCLSIKTEFKNSFKGILHDMSNTNQTCFMEPIVVAELANEKEKLFNDEKMEEEKILKQLTEEIANNYDLLSLDFELVCILDRLFTKAVFARNIDASIVNINIDGKLDLVNARHPLLKVEKVIPNNVKFDEDYLGIIITGPNTGGKTVLLKTVGLLSLMVKFALPIPADRSSNVMIYDHILCDIGDDQSIQENLSTFSSHMRKLINIVNTATPNSLCLFDEIGSGTDPEEGSAIAESVLDYFVNKKISFIATTHYPSLKAYAYTKEYVINACMAFNDQSYTPTYELIIGQSGSSNALSIAKSLGLRKDIINKASKLISDDSTRKQIKDIEKISQNLYERSHELDRLIEDNQNKEKEFDKLIANIDKTKDQILLKAHNEANQILENAQNEAEKLIDEIKEVKNKNLMLHEEIALKGKINALDEKKSAPKVKAKKQINRELKVGDRVFVVSYEQFGTISRINRNHTYAVEVGNITINATLDMLELADIEKPVVHNVVYEADNTKKHVSLTLDLRGMRYDEAKEALDKYIDELIVANLYSATIIHGYGTGTLRELVQSYLSKNKYIDSFRYGEGGEGGFGVTIINLKRGNK